MKYKIVAKMTERKEVEMESDIHFETIPPEVIRGFLATEFSEHGWKDETEFVVYDTDFSPPAIVYTDRSNRGKFVEQVPNRKRGTLGGAHIPGNVGGDE